jgi:hypothetical protein
MPVARDALPPPNRHPTRCRLTTSRPPATLRVSRVRVAQSLWPYYHSIVEGARSLSAPWEGAPRARTAAQRNALSKLGDFQFGTSQAPRSKPDGASTRPAASRTAEVPTWLTRRLPSRNSRDRQAHHDGPAVLVMVPSQTATVAPAQSRCHAGCCFHTARSGSREPGGRAVSVTRRVPLVP